MDLNNIINQLAKINDCMYCVFGFMLARVHNEEYIESACPILYAYSFCTV